MTIEEAYVESFGKLQDLHLVFHAGVNIVEGMNESGKSTLAAFFRFLLYGFPKESRAALSEEEKRLSWQSGKAAGKMTVTAGNRRFEISRSVTESETEGRKESASLIDLSTGLPYGSRQSAGDTLLHMPAALFDNTAFVGQVTTTGNQGITLAEAIENLIFSGDEKIDTARAVSELSEAKNSLLRSGGKGGVLFTLRQKEEELTRRLAIAKNEHTTILQKEATLLETRNKRENAKKQETACIALENDYKNAMLIKTYDYLHELEENNAAIEKEIAEKKDQNALGGFRPEPETLARLSALRESEALRRTEREEAQKEFDELLANDPVPREERKLIAHCVAEGGEEGVQHRFSIISLRQQLFLAFSLLSLLFSGLMLFFGWSLFVNLFSSFKATDVILPIAFLILILSAVTFFVLFLRLTQQKRKLLLSFHVKKRKELWQLLSRIREEKVVISRREEALAIARRNMKKAEERYLDQWEEASRYLMTGGITLPENDASSVLVATEENMKRHLSDIAELEKKQSGVLSVIRELRKQLKDKNEVQVRSTVAPADREKLVALSHRELTDGIDHYRRMFRFYDDKERELERQLAAARQNAEDPVMLSCRIAELQQKIQRLFFRHSAYDLAEDAIRHAGERLRTEISPRLAGYASRLMEVATGGRYQDIGVDKNIDLHFRDAADGIARPAAFLSTGTKDIAYFSLRMALIDLLYSEMPPIFFDESFVHQDDNRVAGVFRALQSLVKEGKQIFLFTCHTREAEIAAKAFDSFSHIRL